MSLLKPGRKHFTSLEVVHKSMSGNETIVRLKTLRLQGLRLMGRMNPNILDMTTISDNLYCRTATFHSGVTFDKLSIAPAVFGDLMPASSSQPLSLGRLSFSEVVFLNDVAVGGSVGNLDILRLVSSTLKTVGDDVVAAQLTFLDSIETSAELDVVRLKTEGKYDLSNDGVAGLSLKVWTGSVVAPSLTTELANVGGMVADVDVNLLFWDTLLIHGEQRVKGTKIIAGDMRVDIPNLMVSPKKQTLLTS